MGSSHLLVKIHNSYTFFISHSEVDSEKSQKPNMKIPKSNSKYVKKGSAQSKISKLSTSGTIKPTQNNSLTHIKKSQKDSLQKGYQKDKNKISNVKSQKSSLTSQKTTKKVDSNEAFGKDSLKTVRKDSTCDVINSSIESASSSSRTSFQVSRHDSLAMTSRLAYSSAMSKPICLCIIWVHLQASVATEEACTEQVRSGANP